MAFYHIYNRGVDKRNIFQDINDKQRFLLAIHNSLLLNSPKISDMERKTRNEQFEALGSTQLEKLYGPYIAEIHAYCLMSNHYHIIVKSNSKEELSKFAQRLGNSYTTFFNKKYTRSGRLFESKYKKVNIDIQEQLIHLTRYIHTNPANLKYNPLNATQLKNYLWSSLPEYLNKRQGFCQTKDIKSHFKSTDSFWQFTLDGIKSINSDILSNKTLIDHT
ncbi:MAG: transposase [Candidatus Beckwithbacteria bacterium]|nr:transposase [Patescibacteria group bacterium]